MNYRENHLRILNVLADELPKRVSFTVKELALKFKNELNPDRAARNALRKPVSDGHVEALDRGTYRLTVEGAGFVRKLQTTDYKATADVTQKTRKKVFAPKKQTKAGKKVLAKATVKVKPKAEKKTIKAVAEKPARRPRTRSAETAVVTNGVSTPAVTEQDTVTTLGLGG